MDNIEIIEVFVFFLISNTTIILHIRAFAAQYIFSCDQIKDVEMNGACGTYGGEEKCIVFCDGET
jgi:hypothetical protein